MSETQAPTARTRVVREAHRGVYERAAAYQILDEGFICHVGFVVDGQPFVIPTGIRTRPATTSTFTGRRPAACSAISIKAFLFASP